MELEKTEYQSGILANRLRNRFRHLSRRFRRQGIECFRLYDWDIPEIRAVVDWYAGHIVIAEYERRQSVPDWLPRMAQAAAEALDIPLERAHMKRRRTKTEDQPRYERMSSRGERFKVRERDLYFWVNLDDFLDTGLYSDHRDTRVIVAGLAKDKDFLNLYGYTGAFTCVAAAGGAKSTVTVDRSDTYLKWARDNLELNRLWGRGHSLIQSDAVKYLKQACQDGQRFNLSVVDPPSFFQEHSRGVSFDINRDHPALLKDVLKVMAPGSAVFFSTNHQRFSPRLEGLPIKELVELTPATIPEDYRNRLVHRCWRLTT